MVIFSGFWAGFICGFVVQLIILTGYSIVVTTLDAKASAEMVNEAAQEVIQKGDLDIDSKN